MADDDIRVPAGWYPDPLGLPQLRWWDNHQWTEHVSDARMPMGASTAGQAQQETAGAAAGQSSSATAGAAIPTVVRSTRLSFADPFIDYDFMGYDEDEEEPPGETGGSRGGSSASSIFGEPILSLESLQAPAQDEAEDLASPAHRLAAGHVPAGAPTGQAYNLDTRFDDLLGAEGLAFDLPDLTTAARTAASETEFPTRRSMHRDRAGIGDSASADANPSHANTGEAWAIVLIPLLVLVFGLLFLLSGLAGEGSSTFFGLVLIVPYVVTAGLAYADWRALQRLGFARPAHWTWSLLTAPVYLAARSRRVVAELSGRGYSPFVAWLAVALLIVVSGIIAPGLVISLSPQAFSSEAANSVQTQAASFGVTTSVECPTTPPLLPGDSFVCSATAPNGQSHDVVVSLQRTLGWIAWRVDDWGGMSD